MHTFCASLSDTDRQWLAALQQEISPDTDSNGFSHKHRALTLIEWEKIETLIVTHKLPCQLDSLDYCFRMIIYDNQCEPFQRPSQIFEFEYSQLPRGERGSSAQSEAARLLSKLTHSEENKSLLSQYGIEFDERWWMYVY